MRVFLALIGALSMAVGLSGQPLNEKTLEAFSFRSVGPAGMSGRVTAIDVVRADPDHIFIGTASGGVWESTDGGVRWTPIFDDQPTLAIGALRINQRNPSEIWVGTGEGNPRNSHNAGKGIFRTLDGGRTWTHLGLEDTRTIHRILVDDHDPRTVYVGAHGSAWGPGEARGVYKTTDSGKTWNKILYTNDRAGVGDMVMDPANPRKLLVAMYEHARTPWNFVSGGKGSGLYLTYDGGETWKQVTSEDGLPKGDLGRIGLAIAASDPDIVYALVEARENGLYKSTDGGEKWSLVSTRNIGNRPFYYHEIYVDPKREDRIWNLYSYVSKSEDGGKTFETILDYGKGVHPDHHAFYIHPDNPDFILDGNDGGLNISRDGGRNWYFCSNLPVGQFYHINIDQDFPYNLYGGMQDNGSWAGPAFVLKSGGIRNYDWRELYFGDGFDVLPKPSDNRYGWAMSQGGNLTYYDRETGFNQFVKPVHPEGILLRFNWNAALAGIPGEDCGIYYGSQFVHRSLDCGNSWEIISPDLTTNDTTKQKQHESGGLTIDATNAENHTTILAIAPSPVDPRVIWAGTDDGNLQLTRDGGATWTNLSARLPGCPAGAWIPQIEVSTHQAGEAFVVINHYRRDDWRPFLYHTTDFGASWRNIADHPAVTSFVQCAVQDPVVPELLFMGADDGLYVSVDKGSTWARFPGKTFPRVSTMDLKIHPTDHSLAIGTFGRSLYVLDNLLPLRALARDKAILEKPFGIFPAADGVQVQMRSVDGIRFTADAEFKGDNRSTGMNFPVYIKPAEKPDTATVSDAALSPKKKGRKEAAMPESTAPVGKDSTVTTQKPKDDNMLKAWVIDDEGDTIRYINRKMKEGWGRLYWDMRGKGVRFPSRSEPAKEADDPSGAFVMPGTYKIVATYAGQRDSVEANVRLDPRLPISPADLAARNEAVTVLYREADRAHRAFRALQDVRKDLKRVETLVEHAPDSVQTAFKEQQKALLKQVGEIEKKFMSPEDVKGITSDINLQTYLFRTSSYLGSSPGAPGPNAGHMLRQTQKEVRQRIEEVNAFLNTDWLMFREKMEMPAWPIFKVIDPVE